MKCINIMFSCFCFIYASGQKDIYNIFDYCQSSIILTANGPNTSIILSLFLNYSQTIYSPDYPCTIKVLGPSSHLLYFRIINNNTEYKNIQENNDDLFEMELKNALLNNTHDINKREEVNKCPLDVFQSELLYSVDPCLEKQPLDDGGLVSNDVQLNFTPNLANSNDKWLVITAVGAGETCLDSSQHSCLQAGGTPLLCISKSLLCNGVVNCPTGGYSSDENIQFCKDRKVLLSTNWEKLASEFLKKLTGKAKPGALLPAIQKGDKKWLESTTETAQNDNLATNFTQYGPWGYLMLGMLLCGTILTLCGLWECCCQRGKPQERERSPATSPTPSSTAVLVLSSAASPVEQAQMGAPPPSYEDLDQPPSYKNLFPEKSFSVAL